jgi:hypothetical protein
LQRGLLTETEERPLWPHCVVSDQELDAYRHTYRPTRKLSR